MSANDLAEVKILDILKRYSDFDHPLTKKDIEHYLRKDYGIETDRKTITRIIENLITYTDNRICYKTDKERTKLNPVTKRPQEERIITDFYYVAPFTNEELRFLIDTVNFAAHVPVNFRRDICKKLKDLGNAYFQPREILMEKRPHRDNPALFDTLGKLDKAIQEKRKVQLKYQEFDPVANCMVPRKDITGNERIYIISPYEFALSGGHYYVICIHDSHDNLAHYRLDRMQNVEILDVPRKQPENNNAAMQQLKLEMRRYCEQHAFMYSGEVIWAKLLVAKSSLDGIVDTFGKTAKIRSDGDKYTVDISAASGSIMHLIKAYAPDIEVLEPPDLRTAVREIWQRALEPYAEDDEADFPSGKPCH